MGIIINKSLKGVYCIRWRCSCLHWKISTLTLSISSDGNALKLSKTACMHVCTHCLPFLRRRVLRLIMDPSEYQSPYTAWILRLVFSMLQFYVRRGRFLLSFLSKCDVTDVMQFCICNIIVIYSSFECVYYMWKHRNLLRGNKKWPIFYSINKFIYILL